MDSTTAPSNRFDVIPYSDLSPETSWLKLGKGSFGSVFKGEYLGLSVAIKEVMESNEYDVEKYFARECKIMQEARHPNIVQYIGLSLAPLADPGVVSPFTGRPRQRILIISEFLPHGNLRSYILASSTTHPMSWPLRLSFATDVARGLAYLHARRCLHRDLKGENLLITENQRVKICDFGFARLEARGEEEKRRLSHCGTDGYMSPEILMGLPFGLETDIFSLGIIFAEIVSRDLVDGDIFRRDAPLFTLDPAELYQRASPRCPPIFLNLILACVQPAPSSRPDIRTILALLRSIEANLPADEGTVGHIGSVSFAGAGKGYKRPVGKRLPSFGGAVSVPNTTSSTVTVRDDHAKEGEDSDEEEAAALARLEEIPLLSASASDLMDFSDVNPEKYSVIRRGPKDSVLSNASTIKVAKANATSGGSVGSLPSIPSAWLLPAAIAVGIVKGDDNIADEQMGSVHTITHVAEISIAGATVNGGADDVTGSGSVVANEVFYDAATHFDSSVVLQGTPHRFTIMKPGWRSLSIGGPALLIHQPAPTSSNGGGGGLFATAFSKCSVCEKRLGLGRVYLQCDDCSNKCHVKCSDKSARNCSTGIPQLVEDSTLTSSMVVVQTTNKNKVKESSIKSPRQPTRQPPMVPVV